MRGRRTAVLLARVGAPLVLLALAVSREGRVATQLWLAAAAVWVTGTLLWDFLAASAATSGRGRRAWRPVSRQARHTAETRGVRSLRALLANAQRNPRAHAGELRARLTALAEHYLPMHRGFEPSLDPRRTAAVLGDVAWLIDPDVGERAPTLVEIRRFLDIVLPGDETQPVERGEPRAAT